MGYELWVMSDSVEKLLTGLQFYAYLNIGKCGKMITNLKSKHNIFIEIPHERIAQAAVLFTSYSPRASEAYSPR